MHRSPTDGRPPALLLAALLLALLLALLPAPAPLAAQLPDDSTRSAAGISTTRTTALPRAHSGAAVGTIVMRPRGAAPDSLAPEPGTAQAAPDARSFSELLQARLPGLVVMRTSGTTMEGSRVGTRGPVSLIGDQSPIVIVDGIRVSSEQAAASMTGTPVLSRLDDLSPAEIERVDILRGPAAAALYGPGAGAGVIVVTTRRGESGRPLRWNVSAGSGLTSLDADFPANYHMAGIQTSTGQPTFCPLIERMRQDCTPTTLSVWNPLEQASPFRTGRSYDANAAIAGGLPGPFALGIRLAGGALRDEGITRGDEQRRYHLHGSAARRLDLGRLGVLSLDAAATYMRRSMLLPWVASTGFDPIYTGLFGTAFDDSTQGYARPVVLPPRRSDGNVDHFIGSINARWSPLGWFDVNAVLGRDRAMQREYRTIETSSGGETNRFESIDRELTQITSTSLSAAAGYRVGPRVNARSLAGLEHEWSRDSTHFMQLLFSSAFPGQASGFSEGKYFSPARRAIWLRQELAWRDRLFLNGGVRWDHQSLLEHSETLAPQSGIDAAWVVGRTPDGSELRLRGAVGRVASSEVAHIFRESLLQTAPPPAERMSEYEIGADAILDGRAALELTYYRESTRNLLLDLPMPEPYPVPVPPPPPPSVYYVGDMHTSGVEALLRGTLLRRTAFRWDAALSLGTVRNRVGDPGYPQLLFTQVSPFGGYGIVTDGQPVGAYWGRGERFRDENGNGQVDSTEVRTDSQPRGLGTSLPTISATLQSELHLAGGISLAAAVEYLGGRKLSDVNTAFRCVRGVCRGMQDPSAPLEEQAAAYATYTTPYIIPNLENGSFARLRELSLTWSPRAPWARRVLAGGAISIVGRNLFTFTGYRGLDPEITSGGPLQLPRADFSTQPIPRQLLISLDLGGGR